MRPHPAAWLVLFAAAASTGRAQEPAQDPQLGDRLKDLRSLIVHPRMAEDFRAISLVQMLASNPAALHPKDRAQIVKALGDSFRTGRVRPPDAIHLYRELADALAKFEPDGGRELQRAVEDNRFRHRDYVALRAHLIDAIGRSKDEKQIDWLLETALRSPEDDVKASAGAALGNFTAMPLRQRRDVVKRLIRHLGELTEKATRPINPDPSGPIDFDAENARVTLQKLQGRWNQALAALTGERFSKHADWQHWLNKNPNWEPPQRSN